VLRLIRRRADAGARKEFMQMLDVLSPEDATLVRMMQEVFLTVQHDAEACAVDGPDFGTQMVQQQFDFTPMDVPLGGSWKRLRSRCKCF
jgi:hypothetical protein